MKKHRLFLFLICIASGAYSMQESFGIKAHKIENNYTTFLVTNNNNSMNILVHHYHTNPFTGARIIIDNNNNPIFYAHTDQGTIIRCNLNEPRQVTLSTQPLIHNAIWGYQDISFTVTVNNFLKNAVTYKNKNWITWEGINSSIPQNESPSYIPEQEKPKPNTATTQQASTDIKSTPDQNAINNKTQTLTSTQSQSTASTTQTASFMSAITILGKYSAALLLIAGIAYVAYKKITEYLQARKNAQEQTHDATIEIGSETNTSTQNNTDEEIIHDETTTIVASTSSVPDEFLKEPVI